MAAPTLQAQGTIAIVTSGDLTPTIPTHQADDILVASVVVWVPASANPAAEIPTPAGWTRITALDTPDATNRDGQIAWFWRRATGAGTTVTFTRGASWDTGTDGAYAAAVYVIRGCETSGNPWDAATASTIYNGVDGNYPAVTVSGTERLVVQFYAAQDNQFENPAAGWTDGTVTNSGTGTDAGFNAHRKDNQSSSTTADTADVGATVNGYYAFLGVSFKPPTVSDRRAQVTWAELEVPTAPRRAVVTFAELEVPNAPRRAVVTFAELEVPTAPRRAHVTWAELEIPTAPRRAVVTWAELELPDAPTTDRRAIVTWAELEVPARRGGGKGFRRILYDPTGAEEEIEEEREAEPDEIPEAAPLPELPALPAPADRVTPPVRLPKGRKVEARVEIVDDEDEIDFILNIVLDLD